MIRGTSNATTLTISKSITSESIEVGPKTDATTTEAGGAGFPSAGSQEYKESDNASPGFTFKKANLHLPLGSAQAVYVAPV